MTPAERLTHYEAALRDIERKGHTGGYHGKGHSLATLAGEALRQAEALRVFHVVSNEGKDMRDAIHAWRLVTAVQAIAIAVLLLIVVW